MSTETAPALADQIREANETEFLYDAEGVCTNPARIAIPCPPGFACDLLIAHLDNLNWGFGFGYHFAGPAALAESAHHPIRNTQKPEENALRALESAYVAALERVESDSPLALALQAWRSEHARTLSPDQPKGKKKSKKTVAEEVQYGQAAEIVGAWDASGEKGSVIPQLVKELGVSVPAAHNLAKRVRAAYAPKVDAPVVNFAAGVPPAPEPDATDAAPMVAAAAGEGAPVLPGMAHTFNENGVAEDPECVEIDVGKGCGCVILLALALDGLWRMAVDLKAPEDGTSFRPNVSYAGFTERGEALEHGLRAAEAFFKKESTVLAPKARSKALGALNAFAAAAFAQEQPPAVEPAPPAPVVHRTEFAEIPVAKIQRNPKNHRKHFDAAKIEQLAESIRAEGLHQPIGVRRLLEGEIPEGELPLGDASAPEFELVFGERRWRAAKLVPVATVPVRIYHGITRAQALSIALVENLQQSSINCMEEAEGYADLMAAQNLTQEQCAAIVGRSRSAVANICRLLHFPEKIRTALREGLFTLSHGLALARFIPKEKDRPQVLQWEMILNIIAEEALEKKTRAAFLEKGVPSLWKLTQAGLAVRIDRFGPVVKFPKGLKSHPAYLQTEDGDWICFDPPHWSAELKKIEDAAKEKARKEKEARDAEIAAAQKKGKKQLRIADLDSANYKRIEEEDAATAAALSALLPKDKQATAKDHDAKPVQIATDVELAKRIGDAMKREIKKDRVERAVQIEERVVEALGKLKKIGEREVAWLCYCLADAQGGAQRMCLDIDAVVRAGVRDDVRPEALEVEHWDEQNPDKRLHALSVSTLRAVVVALARDRLPHALKELIETGPETVGAAMLRWWLDTDTLWLLEETEEGRAALIERVKAAPWYGKAIAAPAGTAGKEDAAK